jgi:MerR family transcriptional regulator, repressor of the yfmOP operon
MAANAKHAELCQINDVSRQVGLSQKRIREYEKEGLIKPEREPRTNNRRYTLKDIDQIRRINELIHNHGFTLASLKYILRNTACWAVFDCREKEDCPSYRRMDTPCYEAIGSTESDTPSKACARCPIYLNRNGHEGPLMNKP